MISASMGSLCSEVKKIEFAGWQNARDKAAAVRALCRNIKKVVFVPRSFVNELSLNQSKLFLKRVGISILQQPDLQMRDPYCIRVSRNKLLVILVQLNKSQQESASR